MKIELEELLAHRPKVIRMIAERTERADSGCLIWKGATTYGYPVISLRVRCRWRTFRVARLLMMFAGQLAADDRRFACHKCDNPSCLELAHLFSGDQHDNMADCARKGRIRTPKLSGVNHHAAKLTVEQVREIRTAPGTERELGRRFGVSGFAIGQIRRGRQYVEVR